MFNVVKILIIFIITISVISCKSSNNEQAKEERANAELLLLHANAAYNKNNHELAIKLIDSIDSVYSNQIDIRRKAMKLRPRIKEQLIISEILKTDSLLVMAQISKAPSVDIYKLRIKKEKLERQLQIARNQIARMLDDNDTILIDK